MTALPADLQDVINQIHESDRAADTLVSGLSDAQFHWQPGDGRAWSIGQCLDHLATANQVYGEAIRNSVDAARARGWRRAGPIASTALGRRFIASLEPPVKHRTRSPQKIQPRSTGSRDDILRAYHESHAFVRQIVVDCAEIDVNRAKFRNPLFPLVRVRAGTGLHVIAAHDRRHLWQADQVRAAPAFPSV
jgi:hypothetical protein